MEYQKSAKIKKTIKLSFMFIILLFMIILVTNGAIYYQIKNNSLFRNSISNLIVLQEDMGILLSKITESKDMESLRNINKKFKNIEKSFENLNKFILNGDSNKYQIFSMIINTKKIKYYYNLLLVNEKKIEKVYDLLYPMHQKRVAYITLFKKLYTKENLLRDNLESIVYKSSRLKLNKVFARVAYYSKEMLFQKMDKKTLDFWISSINKMKNLIDKNSDKRLASLIDQYKNIATKIGNISLNNNNLLKLETKLKEKATMLLRKNRESNIKIEKLIAKASSSFINRVTIFIGIISLILILFILLLSNIVSKQISLNVNIIEEKVEEGLKEIKALNKEIEDTQREVVFTMGAIGESRSKETGNHVKRVAEYSKILAQLYGLPSKEAELLKEASPMHDIGKVAIPDAILNKPGKLTKEEFEIMKKHAILGYEMLKHSKRPILKAAAIVAKEHHEKWDGSGYPFGLKGEEIHIYGRITAIADVFDALGSDRCYKKAWDLDRISELFKEQRGKHFEPKLVDLFFENIDKFLKVRDRFRDV